VFGHTSAFIIIVILVVI